jgi:hypothetical protein
VNGEGAAGIWYVTEAEGAAVCVICEASEDATDASDEATDSALERTEAATDGAGAYASALGATAAGPGAEPPISTPAPAQVDWMPNRTEACSAGGHAPFRQGSMAESRLAPFLQWHAKSVMDGQPSEVRGPIRQGSCGVLVVLEIVGGSV